MSIKILDNISLKLLKEINGENRDERVRDYKEILMQDVEYLPNSNSFLSLPAPIIASIINEADYSEIDNRLEFMKAFVSRFCEINKEDKEKMTAFLGLISCDDEIFSTTNDVLEILCEFKYIPLCAKLNQLYDFEKK